MDRKGEEDSFQFFSFQKKKRTQIRRMHEVGEEFSPVLLFPDRSPTEPNRRENTSRLCSFPLCAGPLSCSARPSFVASPSDIHWRGQSPVRSTANPLLMHDRNGSASFHVSPPDEALFGAAGGRVLCLVAILAQIELDSACGLGLWTLACALWLVLFISLSVYLISFPSLAK